MMISNRWLVAFSLVSAVSGVAHARVERVVEKQFTVKGDGTLMVETHGGEIRVLPSKDAVVHVRARQRIDAKTDAEADELLKKLDLRLEQHGDDIRAHAKYERQPLGFRFRSWPPVNVDFEITVPAGFATELSTSGGAITVGNLDGKANLRTSGGTITIGRMGGTVDARTSGGGISLEEARGAVDLKTSGGNISVGRVTGPADLSTSGGNIKVEAVNGALRAHTSGGTVRAGIDGAVTEECSLSTSGGSVHVTVDKTAAFRLDASSSGGDVDASGLTLTLEKSNRDRSRLAGAVNGGGPLVKVRTSGGGITLRTN